jgi:hypothetical protein
MESFGRLTTTPAARSMEARGVLRFSAHTMRHISNYCCTTAMLLRLMHAEMR